MGKAEVGACLIALPLGAEGGDGGVGGLVVEHAASGRVVRVGEWGERFATGFAFKSGPAIRKQVEQSGVQGGAQEGRSEELKTKSPA